MANVIIAIATLVIGFILATFGAYTSYYAFKRTEFVNAVSSAMERQLVYVSDLRDDLGRIPVPADLVAGRISRENSRGITFSYGVDGGVGYVCAQAPSKDYVDEAFETVSERRDGSLYGSNCNTSGGPSGGLVSITVRIN